MIARALQSEPLDALIWRATGRGAEAIAGVLAVNPGLAAIGTRLPEGTAVTIPDQTAASVVVDLVQLWT